MRSPAATIAWEFRRRHRWGLIAICVYLLVLAIMRLLVRPRVDFESDPTFAFAVIVPLAATFMYFLAVFSFGLAGDIAARQSMYPARMFTLPVTTSALVAWPMIYGAVAMAVLWLATRLLAVWPAGIDVPVFWPMLFGPALLAWTQALTWMPYPLPGMRVFAAVLWLTVIDAIIMIALEFKASEAVMAAILAPQVPLAFLVARFAVARARRGDVPDWRVRIALPQRRKQFTSPMRAQMWLEWRQHGRSLPLMVAIVVPLELALLFAFHQTPVIVFEVLAGVLLTPPFMAAFVAATVSSGVTPFVTTRPMSDASLVGAKLQATIWSTLAAWLLVLVLIPLALQLTGASTIVIDAARRMIAIFGTPRAVVLVLLGLAMLVASTWKQLVQSLYIGMSGREWALKASVFVPLFFLAIAFPLGHWILTRKAVIAMLWDVFPWILAALVVVKLCAAARVAMRLFDRRLLSDRVLVIGAACWAAVVFAVYGLLTWIFPEILVHGYFVALVAILAIPLARLSAAPLALAWNRHR